MSDGTFTTVTTQAWSTYTSLSGRTKDYTDLLTSNYSDFLKGIKLMDGLSAKLNSTTPPSGDVQKAMSQITVLEGALNNIDATMEKFKTMDASAIAGGLEQGKLKEKYEQAQSYDHNLVVDLNNVLYQCQLITADAAFS